MEFGQYIMMSSKDKQGFVSRILETLPEGFLTVMNDTADGLPEFIHKRSMVSFKLIFPGVFTFGLSKSDEKKARMIAYPDNLPFILDSMQPSKLVNFKKYLLVSELPIMEKDLLHAGIGTDYVVDPSQPSFPAFLPHYEASKFCTFNGFRLLDEIEWEYAVRGVKNTLFAWGDEVLEDDQIERWVNMDCSDKSIMPANTFGLKCLFAGEWCSDEYRVSHGEGAESLAGEHVVKGGGAIFWPWQEYEWMWCIPAMRVPTSGTDTGHNAFRAAIDLAMAPCI